MRLPARSVNSNFGVDNSVSDPSPRSSHAILHKGTNTKSQTFFSKFNQVYPSLISTLAPFPKLFHSTRWY